MLTNNFGQSVSQRGDDDPAATAARPACFRCGRQSLAHCTKCSHGYCPEHGSSGRCQACEEWARTPGRNGKFGRLAAVVSGLTWTAIGSGIVVYSLLIGLIPQNIVVPGAKQTQPDTSTAIALGLVGAVVALGGLFSLRGSGPARCGCTVVSIGIGGALVVLADAGGLVNALSWALLILGTLGLMGLPLKPSRKRPLDKPAQKPTSQAPTGQQAEQRPQPSVGVCPQCGASCGPKPDGQPAPNAAVGHKAALLQVAQGSFITRTPHVCEFCSYSFNPFTVPKTFTSPPMFEVHRFHITPRREDRRNPAWLTVLDLPGPTELLGGCLPRLLLAMITYVVGLPLSLAVFAFMASLDREAGRGGRPPYGAGFALIAGVLGTHRLARRVAGRRARDLRGKKLKRKPVLLLRSFADDELVIGETKATIPAWARKVTLEETLVEQFGSVGPVIVIGRPGERLPPIGGHRFWLNNQTWQAAAKLLMEESQLILFVLGKIVDKKGLAWELGEIASMNCIDKLVLAVPPVEEIEVRSRWWKCRELLDWKLPAYAPGAVYIRARSDGRWEMIRHEETTRTWETYRRRIEF